MSNLCFMSDCSASTILYFGNIKFRDSSQKDVENDHGWMDRRMNWSKTETFLIAWLVDYLTGWLLDWLIASRIDRTNDRIIDWTTRDDLSATNPRQVFYLISIQQKFLERMIVLQNIVRNRTQSTVSLVDVVHLLVAGLEQRQTAKHSDDWSESANDD